MRTSGGHLYAALVGAGLAVACASTRSTSSPARLAVTTYEPAIQLAPSEPTTPPTNAGNPAAQPAFPVVVQQPEPTMVQEEPPWADILERLKLYGDYRLRVESDFERDSGKDRHRQRIRVRLGANYEVTDELLAGLRIATGDRLDPNSTHVTLGRGFDDLEINFDRAFLTYEPEYLEGAFATVGKFNNPIVRNPVYGELVWDGDIQPEGAVVGHTLSDSGGWRSPRAVLGLYTYQEQANDTDSFIIAGQVASGLQTGQTTRTTLAVGYYYYTDVSANSLFLRNRGNAAVDTTGNGIPDSYASDFAILNPILILDYQGWRMPIKVASEYVVNTRADVSEDDGWVAGVSLGAPARKGDWWIYYQYQDLGQDAVFSPVAQDDFLLRTNFSGHVFGVNHQLLDKVGLNFWTLISGRNMSTPAGGTQDQWRVRLDLNVKL